MRDQAGVPRGAAGDDRDAVERGEQRRVEAVVGERRPVAVRQQRLQRLRDRAGLLVDLLEHEVAEAAALDLAGLPVERHHRALDRPAVGVEHARALVAVTTAMSPSSRWTQRRVSGMTAAGSRGDDVLAVAEADHQRRPVAEGDDGAGVGGGDRRHRVLALQPACGRPAPPAGRSAPVSRQQVGDHLGVGVRREDDAGRRDLRAQLAVVLDDAVVDDGDAARRASVCGWALRSVGRAVGGPAGVAEAEVAVDPGSRTPSRPG